MGRDLPSGRVTFAFTDVVGSTRSFSRFGDRYVAALHRMHRMIADTAESHGGVVVSTEGDGAFLAFPTAPAALGALARVQQQLDAEAEAAARDPAALVLRIRAGAHTGHATPLDDEYVSLAVHVAARVAATANAGQVIVSQSVQHDLDAHRGICLGEFALKDLAEPVVLWRVLGDDTAPRATPARRTNVAVGRTSFVGRGPQLETLARLLSSPRVVTITGAGGLGKSRLASELALSQSQALSGGAWLAELAAIDDPDHLVDAVSSALGGGVESSVDILVRELQRRDDTLLVLDGCEHLVDAAADLAGELSARCPKLRVLCTSREALDVEGEHVLRLHPLATRDPGRAGTADDDGMGDAERLFLDRASSAGAVLRAGDLTAVSRICRHLDGLPLALELAAARTTSMPVGELADALDAGELRLQRRSGQRHHRSLRDLVTWSLRLLDPAERTALCVLSVFPGGFSAADAKEVLSGVGRVPVSVLPELTRRSLVDLDGDRYRLLLTIRDVARAELDARPETEQAAKRSLVQWALDSCPAPDALPRVAEGFDTALAVQTALRWGLDVGLPDLSPLMLRLRSWAHRTAGSAGLRELALRILSRPRPRTPDEVGLQSAAVDVVIGLGWRVEDTIISPERVRELLDAARATGNGQALYQAASVAATTFSKLGVPDEARAAGLEALDLTLRHPSLRYARGLELGNLALLRYVDGDVEAAEDYMRQAIVANRELGDTVNVAVNQCNVAELLLDRGEPALAVEELRSALRLGADIRVAAAVARGLLVEAEAALGAVDEARALAIEAVPELEQIAAADRSVAGQLDRLRDVLRRLPPDP